jgi:hypothetical protein
MQVITDSQDLADLAAAFPGWHVWRSRDGTGNDTGWYGTRRRKLTPAGIATGMLATLSAGSAASLRALLEQQQVIEGSPERAA